MLEQIREESASRNAKYNVCNLPRAAFEEQLFAQRDQKDLRKGLQQSGSGTPPKNGQKTHFEQTEPLVRRGRGTGQLRGRLLRK